MSQFDELDLHDEDILDSSSSDSEAGEFEPPQPMAKRVKLDAPAPPPPEMLWLVVEPESSCDVELAVPELYVGLRCCRRDLERLNSQVVPEVLHGETPVHEGRSRYELPCAWFKNTRTFCKVWSIAFDVPQWSDCNWPYRHRQDHLDLAHALHAIGMLHLPGAKPCLHQLSQFSIPEAISAEDALHYGKLYACERLEAKAALWLGASAGRNGLPLGIDTQRRCIDVWTKFIAWDKSRIETYLEHVFRF